MSLKPKLDDEDKLGPDSRSTLLSIIILFSLPLVPKGGIPLFSLLNTGISSMKEQLKTRLEGMIRQKQERMDFFQDGLLSDGEIENDLIAIGIKRSILRKRRGRGGGVEEGGNREGAWRRW
jgi:hypothetical protein